MRLVLRDGSRKPRRKQTWKDQIGLLLLLHSSNKDQLFLVCKNNPSRITLQILMLQISWASSIEKSIQNSSNKLLLLDKKIKCLPPVAMPPRLVIWSPSSFLCDAFATTAQYVLMVVMCIYGRVSIRFPLSPLFTCHTSRGESCRGGRERAGWSDTGSINNATSPLSSTLLIFPFDRSCFYSPARISQE